MTQVVVDLDRMKHTFLEKKIREVFEDHGAVWLTTDRIERACVRECPWATKVHVLSVLDALQDAGEIEYEERPEPDHATGYVNEWRKSYR